MQVVEYWYFYQASLFKPSYLSWCKLCNFGLDISGRIKGKTIFREPTGANCAIFGCNISGRMKGIAIFREPTGNDKRSNNYWENIINIIIPETI